MRRDGHVVVEICSTEATGINELSVPGDPDRIPGRSVMIEGGKYRIDLATLCLA
jgi:hypothetical protein